MMEEEDLTNGQAQRGAGDEKIIPLSGLYQDWFLDYASYVILERAVPGISDGLKPVQRRILHAMKELDDGRYNKVANIIGHTMKYHPHGDASIGDALVQLGQKDLLIDCQGNWGNLLTGDGAAAPRYIEARLSKFALEVAFNPKTTEWGVSYDGRNKEPVALPMKFPLLLAQGAEGIAVGLACKILPHNFIELIDASIGLLRGKKSNILPDFPTGGMADFSQYNDGLRGGKVRVRARIKQLDKKTLVVEEIPFGTTTSSLIDSIIKANDKGKIKVKKIEDNTAENAEILIHLATGVSPDQTIDALYAFSDCEVSISPNSSVIIKEHPQFMGVNDILRVNTDQTRSLLGTELEIKRNELLEAWHFASLEKIFIENRIYRDIEEATTWEQVISNIDKGLKPHIKHLKRPVTEDDIVRLTEIKIKRISKFDSYKADEHIESLEEQLKEVEYHLAHLTEFTIDYYKNLKKKYGAGRERKTEIRTFDTIEAAKVVVANKKLYVNRAEGFAGWGIKNDEFVTECSDIDDIIIFREDGTMMVTKVDNKKFVGKDIMHIDVWNKGDKRTIYHLVYQNGSQGPAMVKRFAVTSITRDKDYDLTAGKKGSKVLYFSANPNGEAEIIHIKLRPRPKLKKLRFDFDFSELAIRGRGAKGNTLTKHIVSKIELKEQGVSTLSARKIWYDEIVNRLNDEDRGTYLGAFKGDDKILTVYENGTYRLTDYSLTTHFDDGLKIIQKFNPEKPISAVYWEGERKQYQVKRFIPEESDKPVSFITEHLDSRLEIVSAHAHPTIVIAYDQRSKELDDEQVDLEEFIAVKGLQALGNRLTTNKVKTITLLPPQEPEEVEEVEDETQDEPEDLDAAEASEISEKSETQEEDDDSSSGEDTIIEIGDSAGKKGSDKNKGESVKDEPPIVIEWDVKEPEEKKPEKPATRKKKRKNEEEDDDNQPTLF